MQISSFYHLRTCDRFFYPSDFRAVLLRSAGRVGCCGESPCCEGKPQQGEDKSQDFDHLASSSRVLRAWRTWGSALNLNSGGVGQHVARLLQLTRGSIDPSKVSRSQKTCPPLDGTPLLASGP